MIPSPSDLTYFMEVANVQNLSRAADNLGISQPSLSLAMQRLEACLGTDILIRHKRGVSLTRAGKQLVVNARQLLQQWDKVKAEALATSNDIQGCFTIGCHPSIAMYALPKFLPDLLEKNPKLEIKLQHDISRKITDQVINLSVDIGIAVNPIQHPDLVIKKIDNDKITLWHSSSKRKTQDLSSGQAVLLCDPELIQTQTLLKQLHKLGIQYSRMIPSSNLELLAELTKNGCGIGILPGNVASLKNLSLVPKAPFFYDEMCLLYRGENRDIKSIQVITDAIKKAFKK